MSCNGCRVLRKGCSDMCILRPCLQWIETPQAQGHATLFVAKFFGRAGLMSLISAVPDSQRPALFQSLLFEACGRTVNPVNGAVGLLWAGNWHVCQAAVEKVLRGGNLMPMPELPSGGGGSQTQASDETSDVEVTGTDMWMLRDQKSNSRFFTSISTSSQKCKLTDEPIKTTTDHDLRLSPIFIAKTPEFRTTLRRPGSPSMISEESVTTTSCFNSNLVNPHANEGERKILNLFA